MSDLDFNQQLQNDNRIQEAVQCFLETEDLDSLVELLDVLMTSQVYVAYSWDLTDEEEKRIQDAEVGDRIPIDTPLVPIIVEDGDAVGLPVFSSFARAPADYQADYILQEESGLMPTFFNLYAINKITKRAASLLLNPFDEKTVRISEDMLQVYPAFRQVLNKNKSFARIKHQTCPECGEHIETRAYSKYVRCNQCGNQFPNSYPCSPLGAGRVDRMVNGWRVCPVCRGDGTLIHRKHGRNWNCKWCGFSLPNKAWEDIILWFCDSCDTYMNIQPGFATESGRWVCTVCGQENDVSDDNIEEDYEEPPRLETPVGEIFILLDGKAIPYVAKKGEPLDVLCPDVLGRYQIDLDIKPDGREHTIACFPAGKVITDTDVQTGERLESMAFYSEDRYKLSIGIECESGYIGGQRVNDDYDFDVEYTSASIEIKIYPTTKTETYTIGIAWIDDVGLYDDGGERDVQTWFGADPTLCLANNNEENKHG